MSLTKIATLVEAEVESRSHARVHNSVTCQCTCRFYEGEGVTEAVASSPSFLIESEQLFSFHGYVIMYMHSLTDCDGDDVSDDVIASAIDRKQFGVTVDDQSHGEVG